MSESEIETLATEAEPAEATHDEDDRLTPAFVQAVLDRVEVDDLEGARALVEPLHAADIADLFELVPGDWRVDLVRAMADLLDGDVLAEMNDWVREQVLEALPNTQVAELASELDTDDAVAIIEDMDAEDQREVLHAMEPEDRAAIEEALSYCFADFINSDGAQLAQYYRSAFQPSQRLARPHVMVATWAIAADSHVEAERQAMPSRMMFAHFLAGRLIPIPSIAKAEAWAAEHPPRDHRRTSVGTASEVRVALDAVARDYGADEVMLVNIMADHVARKRSYALIAAEYDLAPAAKAA